MARFSGISKYKLNYRVIKKIDENFEIKNLNTFEEVVDEDWTNTLVQNILNLEHVINNNDKSITIIPREGFQPFGLFHDAHSKKYNCLTLFYGHPRLIIFMFLIIKRL